MAENSVENYLRWITPSVGDPTYSVLKAHLLFEELLNAYLMRVMPHASALSGARLSFGQTLAVARASSTHIAPDHWVWKAVADLNRLRNLLSHEAQPKDLPKRMAEYVSFVVSSIGTPMPAPTSHSGEEEEKRAGTKPQFTAADMATIRLYYTVGDLLGFKHAYTP